MDGVLGVGIGVNWLCLADASAEGNDEAKIASSRDDASGEVGLDCADDGTRDHQGGLVCFQSQVDCMQQKMKLAAELHQQFHSSERKGHM